MQHPKTPIPRAAYALPLAIVEWSSTLEEWLVFNYKDSSLAWAHYDEVQAIRPVMLLNFGSYMATNDRKAA